MIYQTKRTDLLDIHTFAEYEMGVVREYFAIFAHIFAKFKYFVKQFIPVHCGTQ